MKKNDFRSFFVQCKPFLKLKYFCVVCDINPSALSRFLRGEEWDYEMSIESLSRLYNCINIYLAEFLNIA